MSQSRKFQKIDADEQKAYAANKPKNVTPSITYGNATATGLYHTPVWAVRSGQNDHLLCASAGSHAQIKLA